MQNLCDSNVKGYMISLSLRDFAAKSEKASTLHPFDNSCNALPPANTSRNHSIFFAGSFQII